MFTRVMEGWLLSPIHLSRHVGGVACVVLAVRVGYLMDRFRRRGGRKKAQPNGPMKGC